MKKLRERKKKRERKSWKWHNGNTICIERKITQPIYDKQNDYFIKIIKTSTISTTGTISILTFFNDFDKITISHRWFIMYDLDYFYFYTNCIPITIFSTISFSILMYFTDNGWFDPTMGLLLNKSDNARIYSTWNMQTSNFCSEPSLKSFKTSQLQFEMDKIY